jgi:nucleotide-binding universal stress UspA family protein
MTEKPLVVGIDGSPEAREALRWASRLAVGRGCEIVAVHALGLLESFDGQLVSADNHRAEIEELVARDWCATGYPNGTAVRTVVCDGDPVDVLVDVAIEEDAAMLIVGSRGAGATPALALGSTSLHLVQESPVPVLVVPDPEQAARHLALRRILVAIDGTPACAPAIEMACELAARFEARVELVRAIEEAPAFPPAPGVGESGEGGVSMARDAAAAARARRDAEPFCQHVRDHGLPVHMTVERGTPDDAVARVAARLDVDLVVTATHRAGHVSDALLDSVSRRIVRIAHRPTLVVPVTRPLGQRRARAGGRASVGLGPQALTG